MENAGAWTVVGKRRWNSRRLDVRNIAQDSVANMPFPTGFFSTDIYFFHTIRPGNGNEDAGTNLADK